MSCNETEILQKNTTTYKVSQPDFSFCLPFGGKVVCTDGIITVTEGTAPANGVYNTITVSKGCITALGTQELSTTTASPCAPLPTPCDCDGGSITISSQSGNLSKLDSTGGLFTGISFKAGSGIKISGTGASSSPITISASATSTPSVAIQSANAAITISGSGTSSSPYVIKHKEQSSTQSIDGMMFDKFGHLISYTKPSSSATVKGVVGKDGVSADQATNGIVTVSLEKPVHTVGTSLVLGGQTLGFDEFNRVISVNRNIKLTAGTYAFGGSAVTVNAYGSITAISGIEGEEISGTYVAQLTSSVSSWSKAIKLGNTAFLFITIDSPNNISVSQLTIDGTAVAGYVCGGNRYVCLSSASYARGNHNIVIRGTIPDRSYIAITLVSR